jgi:NAD(P)-dependent dehydrogenase (short-subunit alcohol dehydrogenase family)
MAERSLFDLTGKKALVVGGAGGIGKACALGMAQAGADVAIMDLKEAEGQESVGEIKKLGLNSFFTICDVTKPDQVKAKIALIAQKLGGLDIALNSVGIRASGRPLIDDESLDIWHKIMLVNLHSVFYCCREEARQMIPQKYGKIINIASMSATIVNNFGAMNSGLAAYCAAKAGVKQLTKACALEWMKDGIYVNSVSPGYTATPMTQNVLENPTLLDLQQRTTPMGRRATPEEMVGGVIYLASASSSYTTGTDLLIDGGHTIW